ncbi:hypothetical protein [Bradyrhizobium sp. Ai1a-2]|uniref:hypothetical protein n=1 Tax=Bradyrhizobium sp. Ai1a-2 TaxID=196490 RepID=UPI00048022F7|nr:hypothetical protein [Bradyrhizobium sp. Ai1a-2]
MREKTTASAALIFALALTGCQSAAERQQEMIVKQSQNCEQMGYKRGQPGYADCIRSMVLMQQQLDDQRSQRVAEGLQQMGQSLQSINATPSPTPSPPMHTQCMNHAGIIDCNSF